MGRHILNKNLRVFFLVLSIAVESCGRNQTAIVEEYLTVTLSKEGSFWMQDSFLRKLPKNLPQTARLRLQGFARRVWDFEDYAENLKNTPLPANILEAMKLTIEFCKTPAGIAWRHSLKDFSDNEIAVLSKIKITDLNPKRAAYFKTRFLRDNELSKAERLNDDFSYRMMKIFWLLSHPNSPIDEKQIQAKAHVFSEAKKQEFAQIKQTKEMPESVLLRSLAETRLLSDEEFEAYTLHNDRKEIKELREFIFDFDHEQTKIGFDKYMKSF